MEPICLGSKGIKPKPGGRGIAGSRLAQSWGCRLGTHIECRCRDYLKNKI